MPFHGTRYVIRNLLRQVSADLGMRGLVIGRQSPSPIDESVDLRNRRVSRNQEPSQHIRTKRIQILLKPVDRNTSFGFDLRQRRLNRFTWLAEALSLHLSRSIHWERSRTGSSSPLKLPRRAFVKVPPIRLNRSTEPRLIGPQTDWCEVIRTQGFESKKTTQNQSQRRPDLPSSPGLPGLHDTLLQESARLMRSSSPSLLPKPSV